MLLTCTSKTSNVPNRLNLEDSLAVDGVSGYLNAAI